MFHRRFHGVFAGLLCLAAAGYCGELPAGTELQLRLRQPVSSFGTSTGAPILAEVIAPVTANGVVVIPLGSRVPGYVAEVRRVGLGLVRESASIHLVFDYLELPNSQSLPLSGAVREIDNARETVDAEGVIHGIRATASFSSILSSVAISAASLDPMLLAFGLSSSLSTFRIPESELYFPAGTELRFRLSRPLTLNTEFPTPPVVTSTTQQPLQDFVRSLPFRTVTQATDVPSDLTNLIFLGSRDAVERSFDAAGWSQTDARNARSYYGTMRSIVENQGYREAPMSVLLLNGAAPEFTYAKTLNTFFKRHHLRIFSQSEPAYGMPVWTSYSTHDSGIGFATGQKTFIHIIDENIDEERDKVVNDLLLTGCVDAVSWVERPWVPRDAFNSTGDALKTDGRAAVLKLNDCPNPRRADAPENPSDVSRERPDVTRRFARNTLLTLRNDLLRGNMIYQGFEAARMGVRSVRKPVVAEQSRQVTLGGQPFQIVPGSQARTSKLAPKDNFQARPAPQPGPAGPQTYETFLELSISGGYLRQGNSRGSNQTLNVTTPVEGLGTINVPIQALTSLRNGWNIAANVTFNAHRHFSHELGFTMNKTSMRVSLENPLIPPDVVRSDAQVRQFHYALLFHPLPNGARLRPYLAIGPGLQLIRLVDSVQSSNSLLKFAFKELNVLYSAYRFGGDPPLEGGGIFQPTLHYGGGVKYHVTRRFVIRADYRETLSAQPDFWTKSYASLIATDIGDGRSIKAGKLEKYGMLRQQRLSLGIGITF